MAKPSVSNRRLRNSSARLPGNARSPDRTPSAETSDPFDSSANGTGVSKSIRPSYPRAHHTTGGHGQKCTIVQLPSYFGAEQIGVAATQSGNLPAKNPGAAERILPEGGGCAILAA